MELQTEEFLDCPYCGERISLLVDHSIPFQTYVEDCEVCCQPIGVTCTVEAGRARVTSSRADD